MAAAVSYLQIVALCFPCMAVEAVYEGALTGVQRTLPVLLVVRGTARPRPFRRLELLGLVGSEGSLLRAALTRLPPRRRRSLPPYLQQLSLVSLRCLTCLRFAIRH